MAQGFDYKSFVGTGACGSLNALGLSFGGHRRGMALKSTTPEKGRDGDFAPLFNHGLPCDPQRNF